MNPMHNFMNPIYNSMNLNAQLYGFYVDILDLPLFLLSLSTTKIIKAF